MSRKKIGLVSHSANLAGAERVLVNNVVYLAELGKFDLTVIFPTQGPAKELLSVQNIPCLVFPYSWFLPEQGSDEDFGSRLDRESKFFANIFRELNFDLVIINTAVLASAVVGAWRAGISSIIEFHGVFNNNLFHNLDVSRFRFLEYINILIAHRVVTPSVATKQSYLDMFGCSEEKLSVIRNAIAIPSHWRPIAVPTHEKLFVMVANIEPNKNAHMFIRAAAEVIRGGHDVKFEIYGDIHAEYKLYLEEEIVRYGLTGILTLLGATNKIFEVYDRCLALCVCSEYESFSMVAVEAMSCGRPVIATRCGGPEDIVFDEESGFLIERGASSELADKMIYLSSNLAVAKRMGEVGREMCEKRYNVKNIGQEWTELIESVLSEAEIEKRPSEILTSLILREFFSPPQHASWKKIVKNELNYTRDEAKVVVDNAGVVDNVAFSIARSTPEILENSALHLEAGLSYFENYPKIKSDFYSLIKGFSLRRDNVFRFYNNLNVGRLEGIILSFFVVKPTWHGKLRVLVTDVANIEKRPIILSMDSIISRMPTLFRFDTPIDITEPTIFLVQISIMGNTPEIDDSLSMLEFERRDGTEARHPYCLFVYDGEVSR